MTAVQDNYRGIGPLAGIEAALRAAQSQVVFVFGGDMPLLSEELIRAQVSDFLKNPSEILAARSGGLIEPLHSIYSRKIYPALVNYLSSGSSPAVIDFYKQADVRYFELPVTPEARKALTNINRPEDLLP